MKDENQIKSDDYLYLFIPALLCSIYLRITNQTLHLLQRAYTKRANLSGRCNTQRQHIQKEEDNISYPRN
jgi:hypothetical protein